MSSRFSSNVPIGLAAIAGLLLAAGPAEAQSQSPQDEKLLVQARIGELCTVTSASLDFGRDVHLEVNTDASGTIAIACAANTSFDVQLDGGLTPGFGGARALKNGTSSMTYGIFKDAGRTQSWDAGGTVPVTVTGGTGSVPLFGRIPIQGNGHAAGLYTDEVTITLIF
jgi:spore coat protein U-like protein